MSYFYIYDQILTQPKYNSFLARLEARMLELDIDGRKEKLTLFKNLDEIVKEAVKKGFENFIAVGLDTTLISLIKALAFFDKTIGYIPITNSVLAKILGIPQGVAALDIIAKRIIEKLDLGKVNSIYFLSKLELENPQNKPITLICENKYQVKPLKAAQISIFNLFDPQLKLLPLTNPKDGLLEAVIKPQNKETEDVWNFLKGFLNKKNNNLSIFPVKKIEIKSEGYELKLKVDEKQIIKTPAEVEVVPNKLKIIVGRNRKI